MDPDNLMNQDQFERIKLYLRALDIGAWEYDTDLDLLTCDRRWYELLGREFGSINTIGDFIPFIHPDDVAAATSVDADHLAHLIATDQRYHVDFRIIRPDGEVRWLRSVACIVVDPETGHRKAIGCVIDNTELRLVDHTPETNGESAADDPHASRDDEAEAQTSDEDDSAEALSAREIECLSWVSMGKTAWETATIMGRSQRTVEFHLLNATRKLSASNKIHAAVIAVRKGLI
jgi:DNA-binding CsgD family transcriptional regulator